jgi:hypothetical protein
LSKQRKSPPEIPNAAKVLPGDRGRHGRADAEFMASEDTAPALDLSQRRMI